MLITLLKFFQAFLWYCCLKNIMPLSVVHVQHNGEKLKLLSFFTLLKNVKLVSMKKFLRYQALSFSLAVRLHAHRPRHAQINLCMWFIALAKKYPWTFSINFKFQLFHLEKYWPLYCLLTSDLSMLATTITCVRLSEAVLNLVMNNCFKLIIYTMTVSLFMLW